MEKTIPVIIPIMCPTKSVVLYKYTLNANIWIKKSTPGLTGSPEALDYVKQVPMFDHTSILSSMVHKRKLMSAVTTLLRLPPTDPQREGPI